MAIGAVAQTEVTIGSLDGAGNNSYLPMNSLYNYSFTQQIYTADEIGMAGTINSLTLWMYGNANLYEMPFDIYMVEVDKEAFSSTSDWVSVTASDIVYSGSVTVHNTDAEAFTFELTTPFVYSGAGNLVVCFNNKTGQWTSGLNGKVFGTSGDAVRAIYARQDDSAYDPTNPGTATSTTYSRNVAKFEIIPSGDVSCARPTGLAQSNVAARTVDLAWINGADETAWQICINGDEDNLVNVTTNPYQLTGLDPVTAYAVKVRANCGSEQSFWSNTVSFTTTISCPVPTELACTSVAPTAATMSWIAGASESEWTLRYKAVVDADWTVVNNVTSPYTITGLTEETNYVVQVQAVCDVDDQSAWSDVVTLTTLSSCPVPTAITVSNVTVSTATISWADFNDSYTLRYRTITPVIDEGFENGIPATWTTINADGDGHSWLTLSEIPSTYTYYSEIPSWAHSGSDAASSPSFANGVGGFNSDHWLITPQIDLGGALKLYAASTDGDQDSYEVLLSTTGNETTDFTVTLKAMAVAPYGDWDEVSVDLSDYAGQQGYIAIHHVSSSMYFLVIDDFSLCVTGEWVEVSSTEASVELSNLTANTTYEYQVMGSCGSTETAWSEIDSFTTPVSCFAPTDLEASNVTAYAATLTWNAGADETAWQIMIGNNDENIIDVEDNAIYEMTSLNPETSYDVKVRANCGAGDVSTWTNISVTTLVSCPVPTDIEFTNVTATSATVSWAAGSSESVWNLQYKQLSEAEWTEVNGLTTNSYTIDGLTAASAYSVRVQADCETEGTSSWLSSALMTLYSVPFLEEFGTSIPANWSQRGGLLESVIGGTAFTSAVQWSFGSNNGVFDNHAYINIYGTSRYGWLFTPTIVMDANVQLTFDLALTAYSGNNVAASGTREDDKFVVLISTDNGATWTILRQYDNAGSEYVYNNIPTAGEEVAIDLTSYSTDNVIIAFYGESTVGGNGDNNLHIDNVRVDYIPSCVKPTALTVSNVTARTAVFAWTPGADETAWQISLNDAVVDLIDVENNPTYEITNLDPESNYTVKVRANCGGEYSEWTHNVSFITPPTCIAPTTLTATNITGHTATITWAAGADETAWQVMINDNDTEIVDVEDTPTYEMTGLDGQTPYSVKVRAYCDVDDQSAWVNVNFTTLISCPVPTALVASNVTINSATLTWTAGASEASWVLQYGTDNTFVENTEITVDAATVELTDLTAEEIYYARVKAVCGGIDGESQWSAVCSFNPSAAITIGTADATTGYLPTYILYNYSYTQQIYTADEIGTTGDILSVAFYGQSEQTRSLDVYMVATDKTNFESETDWIIVSENDMVFSGSVNFAANAWTTITLTTPFTYEGTSNLAIIVDDNTGTWTSSISFNVYNVESNQSIYYYRDASDINPTNPSVNGTPFAKKNQIRLLIDGAPRYTITATAGENGSITPSGAVSVEEGADKAFTITADPGYRILSVVVDNADATAALVEDNGVYTYTFFDVAADHTITATFVSESAVTYTITATAGDNGTITPSGAVSVEEGADQPFEITPNANYEIDVLTVDSNEITLTEEQREGFTYTFPNVIAGHTINVTFRLATSVEINNAASMAVYPNPNNGMFSIDFSNIEGEATYQLIDARGAVVETRDINVTNGETKMFNHTLTAGTYFVRIIAGDKVYVEQIVVE